MTNTVYQHADDYWVFEIDFDGMHKIFQDVDFQRGGRMHTEERALELLQYQLDAINTPPPPDVDPRVEVVNLKNEVEGLKQENAQLRQETADTTLALLELYEAVYPE